MLISKPYTGLYLVIYLRYKACTCQMSLWMEYKCDFSYCFTSFLWSKEKMTSEMWGSKLIQDHDCRLRYQIVHMAQAAMPASDIPGPAVHLCLPWPAAGYCCWNLLQCLCTQPSHKGTCNNDSSTNRSSVLQLLHTGQITKEINNDVVEFMFSVTADSFCRRLFFQRMTKRTQTS